MEIRFYVDDGDRHDLRVAELLEKYKFRGIFYIAPMNDSVELMRPSEMRDLSNRGHEIGCHTLTHQVLTKIPIPEQVNELLEGRHHLEEIVGEACPKFAYPRGWYNPQVMEVVKQMGFSEARTMKQGTTDLPVFEGNFEIGISVHFHKEKFYLWPQQYNHAKSRGVQGYFGVTCHGWELEKFQLWGEYEKMLKYIYEDQAS